MEFSGKLEQGRISLLEQNFDANNIAIDSKESKQFVSTDALRGGSRKKQRKVEGGGRECDQRTG